ncbi:MAG: phosphoserine phosphatase SerB [Candidatus Bathyarchaeota archaeon]|nr:phosphoserine phosphatase SerB [Candidatus Bathyarchaeota archaeon]MDW8040403.1 phosphoserine phosphatase SerB [Nitrososphaerota archaeon]
MFLVALDFDGVLVEGEYLLELAKITWRSNEVDKITKDGIEGRISWRESLEKRIELLKGVEYEKCVKAAENLKIRQGVREFLDSLRKLGEVKVGVITGCFDIAVNPVKEKLGLDFAVTNELIFNSGKLAGVRIIVNTNKDEHLERIAKQYGVKMENVVAIGDGANDIGMIQKAGLGIAFNPTPILKEHSKINIRSERLDEALPLIKSFIQKRKEQGTTLNPAGKEITIKVLVCDPIDPEGIALLRDAGFEVSVEPDISTEDLKKRVAEFHVLVVRSRTKVTREIIDAGKNLRIIARAGAGVDNIDVEYADKKRVRVICAPEAVATAVAELTMGLMLSLARQIPRADHATKEGKWIKTEIMGWELHGKTIGIVGFGRVGQKVARLAKAFGMKILVCELNNVPEHVLKELDAETVPMEDILKRSDIITLHVPLTQETYHMIGKKEIEQMKDGVYIINTSRGQVIDEKALFEALKTGKIAGAALDVYEKEPPNDFSIVRLPNVVCTPHIGAQTAEAQKCASLIVAQKIVSIIKHSMESACDYKCQECDKF